MSQLSDPQNNQDRLDPGSKAEASMPAVEGPLARQIKIERLETGDAVKPLAAQPRNDDQLSDASLPPPSAVKSQMPAQAPADMDGEIAAPDLTDWSRMGVQKIDSDHDRFRKIVKGKIRENLKKYVSNGEMIGKKGDDLVNIPIPQIDPPRFRFGNNGNGGVGSGDGEVGDSLGQGEEQEGDGDPSKPGEKGGQHMLEVELTLDELADILGEELELPRIEPKGKNAITEEENKYSTIRKVGPESLRHNKRTYKEALKRSISSGEYDPDDPEIIPIREDKRYRGPEVIQKPQAQAVMIYMMDVSGSMTDEQKSIVRTEAFWLDTWISRHYPKVEKVFIIHDAEAKRVDEHTFYHTRESGGTKISAAYELADKVTQEQGDGQPGKDYFPPSQWNIYAFHFTDGDNWGDDDAKCITLLKEKLIPKLNLFGYGQVESPYGSGSFYRPVEEGVGNLENVALSKIPDRDAIIRSIKDFLGKGK